MHMSSRILLVLVAGAAIVAGWWILFAVNDTGLAVIYSSGWTVVVLVAARILLAVGFGYNRLTTKQPPVSANTTNLGDLRDRGVISTETYEADRADPTAPDVLSAVRRAIGVARGPRPLGFVGLSRDDAAIAEVA